MNGIFNKVAVFVDKAEIYAPGIDADRVKRAGLARFYEALFYFMEKTEHVPVNGAAYAYGIIRKTVDFFKSNLFTVKRACNDSAA